MWNICIPNIKLSRRRGAFVANLQATTGADPGFFFRRGCTTKEWRNWLVTGRKHQLHKKIAGHLGGGGVRTPCTLPLDPHLYYFVYYINTLKTTFWSICRGRFPIACPRFPKNSPEALQTFPNIFRRFPKCFKDCSRLSRKIRRCFDRIHHSSRVKLDIRSSISSLLRICHIFQPVPGCSLVWILRVVCFPAKHSGNAPDLN